MPQNGRTGSSDAWYVSPRSLGLGSASQPDRAAKLVTPFSAGLTVLHVEKDFELVARVTGQPVEKLTQ
jgi:hypothetical protein